MEKIENIFDILEELVAEVKSRQWDTEEDVWGAEAKLIDEYSEKIELKLSEAREEVFIKEELECILKWRDACDGEFNGMSLLPASGEDWGSYKDIQSAENKLEKMLSKLKQ